MIKQLIKKDCDTGTYSNMYPISTLQAVRDIDTGETLDRILSDIANDKVDMCNHIYVPFKENSRAITRQQVPDNIRRKGLWITYISCKGCVITEYYNSNDLSDKAWGDSNNWVQYNKNEISVELIEDIVNKALSERLKILIK